MKAVKRNLLVLLLIVLMVSCWAPSSKEAYLEQFERFVERVDQNHKKYTKKDWEWADERFEKYDSEWYRKFQDNFSMEDQIKIKSLIIKYHTLKNKQSVGDILRDLFKDDVNHFGKKLEDYIDNDMDDDIDRIIEGAEAIGDSAVKVLEDVVRNLDQSF